jgi:hypothetical protein
MPQRTYPRRTTFSLSASVRRVDGLRFFAVSHVRVLDAGPTPEIEAQSADRVQARIFDAAIMHLPQLRHE